MAANTVAGNESQDSQNQNSVQDTQNYEINIIKINNDFIKQIDAIRSKVSPKDIFENNVITSDNIGAISSKVELRDNEYPYESRCHAFYRLIGLPVVNPESGDYYNPGFNRNIHSNESLLNNRIKVANALLSKKNKDLVDLMDNREKNPKEYQSFFINQDFKAGITALTSSNKNNIRFFRNSLTQSSADKPFENIPQQHHATAKNSKEDSFISYKDDTGKSVDEEYLNKIKDRSHIIKPFIVDPRIDFSVIPAANRIATPFLKNKSELKISEGVYVKRPYLEAVCRAKFNNTDKKKKLTQTEIDTLNKSNKSTFTDPEIFKKYTSLDVTEQDRFLKFYKIFEAMCKELIKSIDVIHKTESEYNWVPIPDKRGPEFGSYTLDPITINDKYSDKEREISHKTLKSNLNRINIELYGVDNVDLGDFALESISLTQGSPDPETSNSFGDHNSEDLEKLINAKDEQCQKANEALKTIEIIMGEFSSFGFCDIIAIYAALWLLDTKYLEGLLDNDAWVASPAYTQFPRPVGIVESLTQLELKVKEMYQLMDKIFYDLSQNNSKSGS